jgi:hypothetical protein
MTFAQDDAASAVRVSLDARPSEVTVGEPVVVTIEVVAPAQMRLEPPKIGPQLGPFSVLSGSWVGPVDAEGGARWIWNGELAAYRTGDVEIPSIALAIAGDDGGATVSTEPRAIRVLSVLAPQEVEGDVEIADLKPPAGIDPDLGPLRAALSVLALLTIASLLVWWLHRRYAARLAAAAVPEDPFHRTPPHVWVYGVLQELLERRLPEQGEIDLFYSELSRILKRYLGGRFRVELMEQTTAELPESLHQAGAPEESIQATRALLEGCDHVKFARAAPGPSDWKAAVESVYRIVDTTKPVEAASPATEGGSA